MRKLLEDAGERPDATYTTQDALHTLELLQIRPDKEAWAVELEKCSRFGVLTLGELKVSGRPAALPAREGAAPLVMPLIHAARTCR